MHISFKVDNADLKLGEGKRVRRLDTSVGNELEGFWNYKRTKCIAYFVPEFIRYSPP